MADRALGELLYDFGGFNVSTIDSFFRTVLRTFAREIDRQGDYEVELNTRDVISRSISQMLDDFNYNSPSYAGRLQHMARRPHPQPCEGRAGLQLFRPLGQASLRPHPQHGEVSRSEHYAPLPSPCATISSTPKAPRAFVKLLKKSQRATASPYVDGPRPLSISPGCMPCRSAVGLRRERKWWGADASARPHQGLHRGDPPSLTDRPAHGQEDSRTFTAGARGSTPSCADASSRSTIGPGRR